METKKKALGMGLEQLFNGDNIDIASFEKKIYENTPSEEIVELNLDELRPNPYQPRINFNEDALKDLADSIKENGVFQPIIVKKSIKGYEIVAGERRVRASRMAGLKTIPAIIRGFSDDQMMSIALLENLQRENLNIIEEAKAYKLMLERMGLTQEELAVKVGKSRSHITNILGILRLPDEVQSLLKYGKLSMGHARVLSKLEDNSKIAMLANKVVDEDLSVRDLERMIDSSFERKVKIERHEKVVDPNIRDIENNLREKFDTKVKIRDNKIEIKFNNVADLNRILDIIKYNDWFMKEYKLGSVVIMKKNHPCGSNRFEVVRMGADIKIKCLECNHIVMLSRIDFNKRIKKIESY